jgi:ABC-type lipoprotein export system ATPase subunit
VRSARRYKRAAMPLLSIADLTKSYLGPDGAKRPILQIDSFQMDAAQAIALRGESGSGKTTFLNLIAGILRSDAGEIRINGETMTSLAEPQRDRLRAAKLGYIFQTFNLLQGFTCLENVLLGMKFGPGADRKRAEDLLRRVGLSERLHYYPRQLSSGQQQRVAIARALANHPRLVLADEPTGNLDRRNSSEALRLIQETCAENTAALLLVSHDPEVLGAFANVHDFHVLNRALQPAS